MRRTRAEEVLGEWGVRDVTPDSAAERTRVEIDVRDNPHTGKPIRRRLRNFKPVADNYVASLGGPRPYMQRLRQIEHDTDRHLERLAEAYAASPDPAVWRRTAERWNFSEVNDLIDRHNRWYPLEARLPMDPRSRDFVKVGGRPYQRKPLDTTWILERFPA